VSASRIGHRHRSAFQKPSLRQRKAKLFRETGSGARPGRPWGDWGLGRVILRIFFKRIVWIHGIDEARTARTYYQVDFLDRFVDFAARFASLKLALQFNEGLIGTVEPPRQDAT
jgi:hypothetical protein